MANIINTLPINTTEYIKGKKGQFRAISKVRAGFMTTVDFRDFENESFSNNPCNVLGYFKKGALQTVEFKPEGSDYWFTVFARVGKKIKVIDVDMLKGLKVGTINSMWFNTELYSSYQYKAVNAKTWDSMAFVMNEEEMEMA
jgi:hypothetical protein